MSPPSLPQVDRAEIEALVRKHAFGAAGVGLLPLPLLDLVLISGVQLNLLRVLAQRYELPFTDELGRAALSALIGGSATLAACSLAKTIPVYGWAIGSFGAPVFAGASTYAVGRLFVQHFESGGTFLTFDPEAVREHYRRLYAQGVTIIRSEEKVPVKNRKP